MYGPEMMGFRRAEKEKSDDVEVDLEAGESSLLYPGISRGENELRWGFVRKVYGILCAQLLLTTAVAATVVFSPGLNSFLLNSPATLGIVLLPLILMCPLYIYQQRHPLNFVFLGLFTVFMSLSMGVVCANTDGKIVLEALVLTSVVVSSLTGYAFWAARKGKDYSYSGPVLLAGLNVLLVTSLIQLFFPLGSTMVAISGAAGAVIFSGFIVYDTETLIKRYSYDEYIWASVVLYLDILNLFLEILKILRSVQSDN
ncbi:Bax inhibitor-1 family protein [Rhynchospora pubera]|uniref:Bax inhibitor-1 family protein n=1 Tax=Rhynchospora pubera TaxID=906938 RepID=A0AAV8EKT6_9POAL|nr:Bax inhibitor-1 family protein [Rhynchospora pubera]